MEDQFTRLRMVVGDEGLEAVRSKRVAIFGCGGVGGYVVEGLVRSGIGHIDVFDNDDVDITNLNRQLIALHSTLERDKIDVIQERMLDINPFLVIKTHKMFYLPENAQSIDLSHYDYVIDAIDTVTAKIELIVRAEQAGVPIISSMGTGNKLDPTHLCVTDIYKTHTDPLAKVMRKELKERGIKKCQVVYSDEQPVKTGSRTPGSLIFVPASAGLLIASIVFRELSRG